MKHSAGALRERVEVLELREGPEGWAWEATRTVWAGVELTGKSNLFSKVGIGARDALVVLRRQELTLHHALRWRGQHLFLTEITEPERGWLEAKAAVVDLADCRMEPKAEPPGKTFRAVVTEKYVTHTQDEPMAYNVLRHVMVTPKPVKLIPGRIADVGGALYWVKMPHELDSFKNEYEIERTVEN